VRVLLREVVEQAGFCVLAEAVNGAEGIALARGLRPDVITMDLEMPRVNGVEATWALCGGGDCPPIVIVSGSQSSELLGAALAAGARWHVAKRDVVDQLPAVLRTLLEG
jgi:DNA-binding NarL/FixJ family response regulator